jgi:hypothetical protein
VDLDPDRGLHKRDVWLGIHGNSVPPRSEA